MPPVIKAFIIIFSTCKSAVVPLDIPRGYSQTIEIVRGIRILRFGPFVGYYFSPIQSDDVNRLHFICFNERSFYTKDVPENTRIFEGEAQFQVLSQVDFAIPTDDRIIPVIFADAPAIWKKNRPEPQGEFVHFHSCHDATGPVLAGYWTRHRGTSAFRYDMGGRAGPDSILYHHVVQGIDRSFAHIIEFDKGPALQ